MKHRHRHMFKRPRKPAKHGKLWTVEDMWDLAIEYDNGTPWDHIVKRMKRTRSACASRIRIIKIAFIMHKGADADTLMSDLAKDIGPYIKERIEAMEGK